MTNEKSGSTSRSSLATFSINEPQHATVPNVEEKSNTGIEDARTNHAEDEEYITGFRLFAVMFGVSLVAFLIMLDTTIGMRPASPCDVGHEVFTGASTQTLEAGRLVRLVRRKNNRHANSINSGDRGQALSSAPF